MKVLSPAAAGRAPPHAPPHHRDARRGSSASSRATSRSRTSASRGRTSAPLEKTVTHVIHCAASVSFDDAYENSYRANVLGARNALEFSLTPPEGEGVEVHPARRDRDVVHPRAEEADHRPGERPRLPARLLQQLLRADEGDGLARDRPVPDRGGPPRRPAPSGHRHRPLADREQLRRHEGRERADQRVRRARRRRSTPSRGTPSGAARPGSSAPSPWPSPPTARPS